MFKTVKKISPRLSLELVSSNLSSNQVNSISVIGLNSSSEGYYSSNSNYCRLGVSDFGNKVNHLYFLQNRKAYTSEIQHPISEINGFYNPSYSPDYQLVIQHSYLFYQKNAISFHRWHSDWIS